MARRPENDLRFWLAEHDAPLGLLLFLLLAGLLLASALYFVAPRGRSERVEGVVVAIGINETDTGSYPRAVVQLATSRVMVSLTRGHDCSVGSTMQLDRFRSVSGYRYGMPSCNGP